MQIATIVRVPGPWASAAEAAEALAGLEAADGPRFAVADDEIIELVTAGVLGWHWEPGAPHWRRAFEIAARGTIDPKLAVGVGQAAGHVVLIDQQGGTLERARQVMIFADALLRAGGLAVMVESAGVAHSAADWRGLTQHAHDAAALVEAFVCMVGDPSQGWFTCGMHNLGQPDAVVPAALAPEQAADLLDSFVLYLVCEEPALEGGEGFAPHEDGPAWALEHQACDHLEVGSALFNPLGLWALLPDEG